MNEYIYIFYPNIFQYKDENLISIKKNKTVSNVLKNIKKEK